MISRTLPLSPSIGDYTFGCALDGTQYTFRALWNPRDSSWYLDIATQTGVPIATGLRIVLGANLGKSSTDAFFQKYLLSPIDLSNRNVDAGFDDLGTRVVVAVQSVTDLLYNTNS